jgi:hypothetical protein
MEFRISKAIASKKIKVHALRLVLGKAVLKFLTINSLNCELSLTRKGSLATLALCYEI